MRHEPFSFVNHDVHLRGTLQLPVAGGRAPIAVLVPGSGANDRDETVCGHKPFAVIAEFGAARGYAILRYDDRGVGESGGNAAAADFGSSVADICAAAAALSNHPAVDADRLILIGHSEGGLKAAAAAAVMPVAAIVMLAGPAEPIEALLHRQARAISLETGATTAQIEHEQAMNAAAFAIARQTIDQNMVHEQIESVIRRHLASWPDAPQWSDEELATAAQAMAAVVAAPAYRTLLMQEPQQLLSNLRNPILALYGSKDTQVDADANVCEFLGATARNERAAARVFAGMNHLFQRATTGSIAEYEHLPPGPEAEVLHYMFDWLDNLMPARQRSTWTRARRKG